MLQDHGVLCYRTYKCIPDPCYDCNTSDNVIWKLKKPVYGLSEAQRKWYNAVRFAFEKLKYQSVPFGEAFFFWMDEHNLLAGVICVQVDDFYAGGTQKLKDVVLTKVRKIFPVGERVGNFAYLAVPAHRVSVGAPERTIQGWVDRISHLALNLRPKWQKLRPRGFTICCLSLSLSSLSCLCLSSLSVC